MRSRCLCKLWGGYTQTVGPLNSHPYNAGTERNAGFSKREMERRSKGGGCEAPGLGGRDVVQGRGSAGRREGVFMEQGVIVSLVWRRIFFLSFFSTLCSAHQLAESM